MVCEDSGRDLRKGEVRQSPSKLSARIAELEAQLLDSARAIQEGIALAAQLGKDGAERERQKYLMGYSDGHREALR